MLSWGGAVGLVVGDVMGLLRGLAWASPFLPGLGLPVVLDSDAVGAQPSGSWRGSSWVELADRTCRIGPDLSGVCPGSLFRGGFALLLGP